MGCHEACTASTRIGRHKHGLRVDIIIARKAGSPYTASASDREQSRVTELPPSSKASAAQFEDHWNGFIRRALVMHLYLVDTHLHSASPVLTGSCWSGFVTFLSNHGAGACFHEGISETFVRSKAPRESVRIQRLFKLLDTKGYLTEDKIFVPGSFFRTQRIAT